MKKHEKHQLVFDAEKNVKDELSPKVYSLIGIEARLLLIKEKLPKVSLNGTAQIRQILSSNNNAR